MAYTKSLDPLNNHQLHRGTLTADDVVTLRQRHAAGLSTTRELADAYNVSPETIRRAIRGETWRHLQLRPDPLASPDSSEGLQESLAQLAALSETKTKRPMPSPAPTAAAIGTRIAAYTGQPTTPSPAELTPPAQAVTVAPGEPIGALALPAHYPVEPNDPAAG